MELNEGLSIEQVLRAVFTRKRAFGATFVASSFVFGAAAAAVPPSYKASVVMTIDPGRYPNDFLRPNVIPALDTRLGGMQKMLESAPVIEELRVRTGLAAKDSPGGGLAESLGLGTDPIDSWRKAFSFQVLGGFEGNRKNEEALLVEMAFKGSDPETCARVVNECAKRANEENNRFRRAFVEEVVRFIQKAQERAKETRRQREESYNSFKLSNTDKLPEQEAFIAAKLGQLRIRYADLKQSERFAEARVEQLTSERGLLVAQIALNVQIAQAQGGDSDNNDAPNELRRERHRLQMEVERREDEYMDLKSKYTDQEPRVRFLGELLEKSKARLAEVESRLRTMGLVPGEFGRGDGIGPVKSTDAPSGSGPADFKPTRERKLFPDDPYEKPGQKVPNSPLNHKLEKSDPPREEKKDTRSEPAKAADKAVQKTLTPMIAQARVVELLTGEKIDERTLQTGLDEMSYRLVVSNPSYGRIRQIDFVLKETKTFVTELARQREEAFSDIKKAEDQLASIPEVRQRIESLSRDLIEAREDARRLSDQLDNAKKALEVENENKGEQFRVIDFARPPSRPMGAGRGIYFAAAAGLALAFAGALCVLLDLRARGFFAALLAPEATKPALRPAAPATEQRKAA